MHMHHPQPVSMVHDGIDRIIDEISTMSHDQYVELHSHSFYSFGEGASHVHELLDRAVQLGYPAMGLTDYNMCGALEFARQAKSLGIKPLTGGELILSDGSHVVLLAKNRKGYSNISQLFTFANMSDRRNPRLDPSYIPSYSDGVVLLTGSTQGTLSRLVSKGRIEEAENKLHQYLDWFGCGSVYVELNRNFVHGDKTITGALNNLARRAHVPVVATNNVHYHVPERHRLQNLLVAMRRNTTIDQVIPHIKPNSEFYMKSAKQMSGLFESIPDALSNTLKVADMCNFDLSSDLGYALPNPDVPDGYTPLTYLKRLCHEAAIRRYGFIDEVVESRLAEELRLIHKHGLAGFMLIYREIAQIARELMIEIGRANPEDPLEWRPPGRGRGSSVAMLTGYLIGISHIDPLIYDLTLERFLPDDLRVMPDIDLDFPRSLREKLLVRVQEHFGSDFAVLAGMITTYRAKGAITDVGKALGIPKEDLLRLSKQIHSHEASHLRDEMLLTNDFRHRVDNPLWRDLIYLAPQLQGAPKRLGQHVGGMILSSTPVSRMVPSRQGAIEGRYIIDWDKDSVADAGFAKIDILSLPVLDQLEESVSLIERRTGNRIDLSRIDHEDSDVYDMINRGESRGVFLLQSPAQLKMGQRLMSRNLQDLAYQVALIRPGVGLQGSAVSDFIKRYRHGMPWTYDHPLEERALKRGYGIIVWQEQVVQLISDVSGLSQADADEMRRAFIRRNNEYVINSYWERFRDGALSKGVDQNIALKIFEKINGHYMFPESHSHAFAVSAYQAAWMKYHYTLEFFVTLMNNQPMGFYPIEAIKQDARRFGVPFLNPCVNLSDSKCSCHKNSLILGLEFIKGVGVRYANEIIRERVENGLFSSVGDFVRRVSVDSSVVESLVYAGAFDLIPGISRNRKRFLWEAGVYPTPFGENRPLPLLMDDSVPELIDFSSYEKMLGEYKYMDIYPSGHIMEFFRHRLPSNTKRAIDVYSLYEGQEVTVGGWAIARQHPSGNKGTVFVTVEDETGDVQLIVWRDVFDQYKHLLKEPLLLATGFISNWDGTTNIVVSRLKAITATAELPSGHDWH